MFSSLVVTLGLLAQVTGSARAPDRVTVWRADSTLYVKLSDPGHVVLLHVDAIGRIQVLFPELPGDNTAIAADAPLAIALPPTAQANPATFVAVRSRWPFAFTALKTGFDWDYENAWLLQPTAGDPLGALLDIADRITDGRPYDYGVISYARDGLASSRRTPIQPDVCLSCVRHGAPAAAVASAAGQTNNVDCSNALLTNAFCGVNNGSVAISSEPAQQPAYEQPQVAQPVYVPYYVPFVVHSGRSRFEFHEPRMQPARPPQQGVAYPIAPRLVVPSRAQIGAFTGRHR
jgi:hypothetical protein